MTYISKLTKAWYWLLIPCIILSACKKNQASNPDNQPAEAAIVENIIPNRGLAGDTIIINGINFSTTAAENFVMFNGKKGTVIAATNTKLTVKVPQDGTTGNIEIQVKNSALTIAGLFTYPPAVTITAVTPSEAQVGESIVISGKNFRELRGDNTVLFNGIKAVVTGSDPDHLTVVVPQGATGGNIQVIVDRQVVSTTGFTILSFPKTLNWQDVATGLSNQVFSTSKDDITIFCKNDYSAYPRLYRMADGQVKDITSNINVPVSTIFVLTSNANYFFLCSSGQMFRSTDGINWTTLFKDFAELFVSGNKLTGFSLQKRYSSTDNGLTWLDDNNPLFDALGGNSKYPLNVVMRYFTDVDDKTQYVIVPFLQAGNPIPVGSEIFRSVNGGITWQKPEGNLGQLYTSPFHVSSLAASGGNLFGAFIPPGVGTSYKQIYKSLDKGNTWSKLNNDKASALKASGDYVIYGYNDLNVSFDKGQSFVKYSIPSGYIIGSIEISGKTVYIFCKNSEGFKIFKARL
jgi:hypothetical protein